MKWRDQNLSVTWWLKKFLLQKIFFPTKISAKDKLTELWSECVSAVNIELVQNKEVKNKVRPSSRTISHELTGLDDHLLKGADQLNLKNSSQLLWTNTTQHLRPGQQEKPGVRFSEKQCEEALSWIHSSSICANIQSQHHVCFVKLLFFLWNDECFHLIRFILLTQYKSFFARCTENSHPKWGDVKSVQWPTDTGQKTWLQNNVQLCRRISATWSEWSQAEGGARVHEAAEQLHFQQTISGCILNHPRQRKLGRRKPWEIWRESHLLLFRAAEWKSRDQRGRTQEESTNWPVFFFCLWAAQRDSCSVN